MNQLTTYLTKKGYEMPAVKNPEKAVMVFVPYEDHVKVVRYIKKQGLKMKMRFSWNYDTAVIIAGVEIE